MSLSITDSNIVRRDGKVAFMKDVNGGLAASPISQFVSEFTSDGKSLPSGWAGAVPRPIIKEGAQSGTGVPQHRSVKFYEHTVTPVEWDNTIDVDLATYEDAKDNGVQSLINLQGSLGAVNAMHLLFRAQQVLMLGTGSTVATDYSGNNFFADAHEVGATLDNNRTQNITSPTAPTVAELELMLAEIIPAGLGFTDDRGKVYDHDINNYVFMFPAGWSGVASQVLSPQGTIGGSAVSTVGTATDSGQASGRYRGYQWFANGDMADADRFVAFRKPRNGNVGPLIANMRVPWDMIMRDRNSGSDYSIEHNVIWFTSRSRWDIGYGDPRSAIIMIAT